MLHFSYCITLSGSLLKVRKGTLVSIFNSLCFHFPPWHFCYLYLLFFPSLHCSSSSSYVSAVNYKVTSLTSLSFTPAIWLILIAVPLGEGFSSPFGMLVLCLSFPGVLKSLPSIQFFNRLSISHSIKNIKYKGECEISIENAPTTFKWIVWQHFGFAVETLTECQTRHEQNVSNNSKCN